MLKKINLNLRTTKLILCIGWGISLALFLGVHIYFLRQALPLDPYMDSLRIVGQIFDVLKGKVSILEVWRESGPSIFYHLITLIEWIFWGLNTQITVIFTALSLALTFMIYIISSLRLIKNNKKSVVILVVLIVLQLVSACIFFSPAGWEIWLLDLGLPQVLKNFIIVIFLYYLSRTNFALITTKTFILTCLLAVSIVLFVSAGWSYAFTATVLFFSTSLPKRSPRLFLLPLSVLLSQICFWYFSSGVTRLGAMSIPFDLSGLQIFLSAFFYGISTAFIGNETLELLKLPAYVIFLFGALFFIVSFFLMSYILLAKREQGINFFMLIYTFGLFTLLSIAISRGGQGYQFVGASRYFMDFQFIFFGFMGMYISLLSDDVNTAGVHRNIFSEKLRISLTVFFIFFVLMAASGHLFTYYNEYRKAPYRALAFKAISDVYRNGTLDVESVRLLQTTFASLEKALPIFKQFNLGSMRKHNTISKGESK